MNSIPLKTKELLKFHFSCYGKRLTIVARYKPDAYYAKESPYQIQTQYDLKQRSNLGFTIVAMAT